MKVLGVLIGIVLLGQAVYWGAWLGGFRPTPEPARSSPTYSAPRYTRPVPVQSVPTQQSTEDTGPDVHVDADYEGDDDHESRFCRRHWYC